MCFVFIGDMTKTFDYVDLYKLQSLKKFASISQRLDESPLIQQNFSPLSCLVLIVDPLQCKCQCFSPFVNQTSYYQTIR